MLTLILDDEPLAVDLFLDYVSRHRDLELAASLLNPIDALDYLKENKVDLVLLDVQMPELNGLHVARLLRNECAVILTTAYENHALAGYELDVVDYLLKPISFERFGRAVDKVRLQAHQAISASLTSLAPASAAPTKPDGPFFVKTGHKTHRLDLEALLYASSSGDYLTLFLADGTKLLLLESLTDFTARLPAKRFSRIHRSHLVALDKTDFIERKCVVINNNWLPVSDDCRDDFRSLIGE